MSQPWLCTLCLAVGFCVAFVVVIGIASSTQLPRKRVAAFVQETRNQVEPQPPRPALGLELVAKAFARPGDIYLIKVGVGNITADNSLVARLSQRNIHALLLEPSSIMFETLRRNLQMHWAAAERLVPVQAMVCPGGSSLISLFTVKKQFAKTFPNAPHWAKHELSSVYRSQITKRLQEISNQVRNEGGFEEWVDEAKVDCLAPSDLLSRHELPASSVDMLVVDAGVGLLGGAGRPNSAIVNAFLSIHGFLPEVIVFNTDHLTPVMLSSVLQNLSARGYRHDCITGGHLSCNTNAVASRRAA